ncbi:MAG TPA: TrkA C-terminal domain-containing protein, partial [Syntrophales bacterium]|nr:TrkA C-terminal domain-containing protein [Syntrophales bacterium]HQK47990.1 TrkA C-terminal domain-containing protein [Syntrophales bacterium]
GALVVLINRGEEFIIPTGGTVLNPGDRLLFLAVAAPLDEARAIVEAPREQPNPETDARARPRAG